MRKLSLLALVALISIPLFAQTPPVVNANGTVTGSLHGTLNNGVLTIDSPGNPGVAPTLSTTNLTTLVRGGTTASIGGGALLAGACATGTVSISGAATTMVAVASASTSGAPGAAYVVKAQVTSAGTATVSVCAIIDGTPTASTYLVRVLT